jgi:2-polyprenyl-3-methyl-5-hydroxy-6-metoxy-1,4-benzoquinol methylase
MVQRSELKASREETVRCREQVMVQRSELKASREEIRRCREQVMVQRSELEAARLLIGRYRYAIEPKRGFSKAAAPFNRLTFSCEALEFMIRTFEFSTVLDIGSGEGQQAQVLREYGKIVTENDYAKSVYFGQHQGGASVVKGDYNQINFDSQFDAVFASHVLEHQLNPHLFLKKVNSDLKEGGVLVITVPPMKHQIVGGHLSLWNGGMLLYHLIMAGFDCRKASLKRYGYNISIVLKKISIVDFPELQFDKGDIDRLSPFLPEGFEEPFDGNIKSLNWNSSDCII